jgi:hypothetical protein
MLVHRQCVHRVSAVHMYVRHEKVYNLKVWHLRTTLSCLLHLHCTVHTCETRFYKINLRLPGIVTTSIIRPNMNRIQYKRICIVVLFGFLNIKSVKIHAIPYIFFSTTLLLYKLDTLLLKQKKRPVFGLHMSTHAEKEIRYTSEKNRLYLDISRSQVKRIVYI